MKTFSRNYKTLRFETLEDRSLLSLTAVADFEGLLNNSSSNSWNGDYNDEMIGTPNSFTSGPCRFDNITLNDGYYHWGGFGYSRKTDTTTSGYENEMSAYPGIGANYSPTYGIGYYDSYSDITLRLSILDDYVTNYEFSSLMVANTTYAALSISNGDDFSEPFGEGDHFELIITGKDAKGQEIDKVEVVLADYRDAKTFVLDTWKEVDISSLKNAVSLEFTFQTTDESDWGPNTPFYVAIDDVTLTEKETTPEEPKIPSLQVTTQEDQFDENPYENGLSLREAIALINNHQDNETYITFANDITEIQLTKEILISAGMKIEGGVSISAASNSRIFTINAKNQNVEIVGLTLQNGNTTAYGGAIYQVNGDVNLKEVTFQNNKAEKKSGGAVYQTNGNFVLEGVIFNNNKSLNGGAFYQKSGTSEFVDTTFENNTANYGGAVYLSAGEAVFKQDTQFIGNVGKWGGAVFTSATILFDEVVFLNNTATWGGAVYQSKGKLEVTSSSLIDNKATYGGGFYFANGEASLINTTISASETTRYGTAIAKPNATKLKVQVGKEDIYDKAIREYVDELSELSFEEI